MATSIDLIQRRCINITVVPDEWILNMILVVDFDTFGLSTVMHSVKLH